MKTTTCQILLLTSFFLVTTVNAARAQSITRIKQNDPSVIYSGNWYTNENSANTDSLAALTNTRGSRASLTFTGSGISWIGVSDGWSGLATVYLDGQMTV